MTKHLTVRMDFPAPVGRVWEMLGDPGYLGGDQQPPAIVTVAEGTSGRVTTVRRTLDVDLPAPFSALFSNGITLDERHQWEPGDSNAARSGTLAITVDGAPASVAGHLSLMSTDDGCALELQADVTVAVPLFGAKAEALIAETLRELLAEQETVGRQWLAR